MNESSVARKLAEAVAPHFAQHTSEADSDERLGVPPDASSITTMVEAAFWASLRREEGYVPKVSIAHISPDHDSQAIRFDKPFSVSPDALTKIGPAVERPGVHLAVWRINGDLAVWGTTRDLPSHSFVLEVIAPGLLVIKHSRERSSNKFVNVAVLEGDRIKVLDAGASAVPDCPGLITSLLGFDNGAGSESTNVLVQIALSMREHGRGGLLLVVPAKSDWQESVLQPILYAVTPPFSELAALVRDRRDDDLNWQSALRRSIAMVAGLTAVDGATVVNVDYELLAFGAKIGPHPRSTRIEQVRATEPVVGSSPTVLNVVHLGGTRHLAAAQFVHDQRDAIALVASQDGRFTIFAWSPCEDMVQAHRVEALLL